MNNSMTGERWIERVAEQSETAVMSAPSRLKSRIYSALLEEQALAGGLSSLSDSRKKGFGLCVFEGLVHIAPVGEKVKRFNYCRVCHARFLGEHFEGAPIFWKHCPYAEFQSQ